MDSEGVFIPGTSKNANLVPGLQFVSEADTTVCSLGVDIGALFDDILTHKPLEPVCLGPYWNESSNNDDGRVTVGRTN